MGNVTIKISGLFEDDRKDFEDEFDKISKMTDAEKQDYLKQIKSREKRLKKRYISLYGEKSWNDEQKSLEQIMSDILSDAK